MNGTTQVSGTIKPRATLAQASGARVQKPPRVVIYGPEGIGKTTFATDAGAPLVIGAEDGSSEIDLDAIGGKRIQPVDWENVFSLLGELATSEHSYKSIVIDTLDWLQPICWAHICEAKNKKSIEDFDYGKGYTAAVDEWRRLLHALDRVREVKRMAIILVGHSKVSTFKNPEGDDYDRYSLDLHEKSSGLIKQWSDAVLFATYETYTHENKKRVRGISTGARLIKTVRHAAYDAKNRYNLPEEIPLSWADFSDGMQVNANSSEALTSAIVSMLVGMKRDDQARAREAIGRAAGDSVKLAKLADWCRGRTAIEGTKETEQ